MNFLRYHDAKEILNWQEAIEALHAGHLLPRATMHDCLMGPEQGMLLNRTARVEGLGYGVKVESVFNLNAREGLPNTHGVVLVYAADNGILRGVIDSHIITDLKTAADSVLGATILARPDSKHLVILGAGRVAANLVQAYSALFPQLEKISIWSRRLEQAQALIARLEPCAIPLSAVSDLSSALHTADIISSATLAQQPLIFGEWIRPGTHVDLIGAFTADAREADDTLMAKARVYVDNHETTCNTGEIALPIKSGIVPQNYVEGDLYDLVNPDHSFVRTADDITVYKNAGGAHFDLMIAHRMLLKKGL
ncbi:ornithine cyclodeaminase family protein [Acinetobacter puyangensis]|uniref:ornithine cyclodeaminase family protein n=1 Tax=Acinetobacter puyangensis TaxID=1096779 RepID=UPI003A4D4BAE